MQDYTIAHKSGWTIYSDTLGQVWIRGRYHRPEDFPDLAKMNAMDCFTQPLPKVFTRQRVAI